MMADTALIDAEIAQAEARAHDLRAAKQQRRFALQGKLASLEHQLSMAKFKLEQMNSAVKQDIPDVNAIPEIQQLAKAWNAAGEAYREHGRKMYFGGLGERSKPGYFERVEAEHRRLLAEANEARRRYDAAFFAKHNELSDALEQATGAEKQHLESTIADLRRQIDAIETELRTKP